MTSDVLSSKPLLRDLLTGYGLAYLRVCRDGAEHAPALEAAESAIASHVGELRAEIDGLNRTIAHFLGPDGEQYIDRFAAAVMSAPGTKARQPDGYAYRYPTENGSVIRFSNGGPVNGTRPSETIPYFLGSPEKTSEESVSLDYKLPCEVRIPPSTSFGRGVTLRTLMYGLRFREGHPDEYTKFDDERSRAIALAIEQANAPDVTGES